MPEHAQALAYYDHAFFGRWPAITRNQYGEGTLTYEGAFLSDTLQEQLLLQALRSAGLTGPDQELPAPVRVKHGVNALAKRIHYYLNYSSAPQTFRYPYVQGTNLLTGESVRPGPLRLAPWDTVIVEER